MGSGDGTDRPDVVLPIVVSNASALIALQQIGHLDLLLRLFSHILVPPAVREEVSPSVELPPWIEERELLQPMAPQLLRGSLGKGEGEALSLALEVGARWVILDDRSARRAGLALGLPVVGVLGILVLAKRRGVLSLVRPCLDALRRSGFHISSRLHDEVLARAGEALDTDESP